MKICIVIPAAGHSTRYIASGANRHKLDEDLGGREVIMRSIELFANRSDVSSIVVAGPCNDEDHDAFRDRYGPKLGFLGATLCKGGRDHRYESVQAALEHVPEETTHIAVHDAARPCASPRLIDRLFEAAQRFDAVVPGVPVGDTLKRVEEAPEAQDEDPLDAILGESGKSIASFSRVTGTVDRLGVVAVQTPQVFARELLVRAYGQADLASTDDAGLVEKLGEPVMVIEGEKRNFKITTKEDLEIARSFFDASGQNRESHKRF